MRERTITTDRPVVRRRMTVGAADDRYEREADRVAKRVVTQITGSSSAPESVGRQSMEDEELAMKRAAPARAVTGSVGRQSMEDEELAMKRAAPARAVTGSVGRQSAEDEELAMKRAAPARAVTGSVARQSMEDEELAMKRSSSVQRAVVGPEGGELDRSVAADIDAARGGGRPLEPGLRRSVEPAFGADFSSVRVHTGGRADRLNADLGARAFTTGSDVFVRSADYRPDTSAGKELLAHELTHVVQQGGAPSMNDR